VHHPEVCYPAQGFKLLSQRYDKIQSSAGDIRVKRLATSLGNYRLEPVTYWITIGQTIALTGTEKKLAELKHGLRGEIVDGLLFRVSTIDKDTARAYKIQDEFISTMVKSLPKAIQEKLLGNLRPA
jgi:EpsI family protein